METNTEGARRRGLVASVVIGAGLIAAFPVIGLVQDPEASFQENPGSVTLVSTHGAAGG